MNSDNPFPNYLSMPARRSLGFWHALRFCFLAGFVAVAVGGIVRPADSLAFFWGILIPVLPAVFLIAPGSWRNVCPLAAANQASRYVGVTRQVEAPAWLREHGFSIGATLFVAIALTRKVLFNRNGIALTVLLLTLLFGAALGGRFLKGKSGWCSSICPLLPVQRVYGQTPFIGVANSHCRPCVGCTKNCYDFNPRVAYVADMHDPDQGFRGSRRLFIGAFPGLVLGYFLVPDSGRLGVAEVYGRCLLWIAASIAVFAVLDAFGRFSPNRLPPLFGATAFSLFYWFGCLKVSKALHTLVGGDWHAIVVPMRSAAIALAVVWLVRSWRVERSYVEQVAAAPVRVDLGRARSALAGSSTAPGDGLVEIEFSTTTVAVRSGSTILEAVESAELSIESGCRMGVCGADPVAITSGCDSLSPIGREEADTLVRLGLGPPNRMACVARAEGSCTVSLTPDRSSAPLITAPKFEPDPSVRRVVIVGNGIAGVTVADFVRRNHPDAEITLIGRESHQLYNRMGVARLIYGRSAMNGLYLLPDKWCETNRISLWLNTRVTSIDREHQTIRLGTGHEVAYDRLVLATGGSATVPPIKGFGMAGCSVLRDADDAIAIRAYAQDHERVPRAIVAGGGLLGLEAAHALHEFGMTVTVFERSSRLLRNCLDPIGSEMVRSYFEAFGISVVTDIEVTEVQGQGRMERVITTSGQRIDAEIFLVAAGVTPNIDLGRRAGLAANRGLVVDAHLRTNDPNIYALGDLAEFEGRTWGLWPVAVNQAQIVATNVAGGERLYSDEVPTTILKGVGLDVVSFGRIEPGEGDRQIAERGEGGHGYRKIVLSHDSVVVGGVFLGFGDDARRAQDARDSRRSFGPGEIAELGAGDWSSLAAQRSGVAVH